MRHNKTAESTSCQFQVVGEEEKEEEGRWQVENAPGQVI
jgi:hypothetical protein